MRFLLVDDLWSYELLVLFVLDISQQKDEVFRLTGLQLYLNIMRGNGTPSVCMTIAWFSLDNSIRIGKFVIESYEGLTISVETLNLRIHMVESIVVATLAIFCLVIDGATLNLDFSCREVTLEILHVSSSIPQTPLFEREEFQFFCFVALVGQCQLLYFGKGVQRNEKKYTGFNAVLTTSDAGVAHAVTALVEIQWRLARFPSRIPDVAVVVNVKVASAIIHRYVVVAIAGDTSEFGVLVERIASSSIGDE